MPPSSIRCNKRSKELFSRKKSRIDVGPFVILLAERYGVIDVGLFEVLLAEKYNGYLVLDISVISNLPAKECSLVVLGIDNLSLLLW